jgi:hypothetical protein
MLLGKFFRQERIAKRAWELYVKGPACVHVSHFCTTETELPSTKPMYIHTWCHIENLASGAFE